MKTRRISALLLSALFLAAPLTGCGTTVVVVPGSSQPAVETTMPSVQPTATTPDTTADAPVKTGLYISTSLGKSKDAAADAEGLAQSDISLVAVTVDDNGVINSCVIDAIQAKINFSADGKITTDLAAVFESKNVMGDAYGMRKGSSIGKEWNEQAAAFAQYAQGKTVEELKSIAVDESGKAADADLAASVTLYLGGFIDGVEAAVGNAQHMGAQKGDKLSLTSATNISKSKDAAADQPGVAQAYATIAAVTLNGDVVTSCYIDAVQANVNFDAAGKITTDLASSPATKNQLGDDYGMRKASSIGKEWNEQAAAFCAYVTGKTVSEVAGLAVTESGKAADADLAASVTVGIGEFRELVAKAAA